MLTTAKFLEGWRQLRISRSKVPALLAVSGGVDSMVMAALFLEAKIPLAISHCNFGLRGKESEGDAELVHEFAAANDLCYHQIAFDTEASSAEAKTGIQETARNLRYDWLRTIMTANNYSCICTAHHRDDVAETVLINLARGTGISGLHGIRPVHGNIVRPLLSFSKDDIQTYARESAIKYREDASNSTDVYTRNAVRHHILPSFEKYMPGASLRISESAMRIAEAEILYQRSIDAEHKKLLQQRGKDFYIAIRSLKHREPLSTIMFELLKPFQFSAAQTAEVLRLMDAESGKSISSPSHLALKNRDFIIITKKETAEADLLVIEDFSKKIETANGTFEFTIVPDVENIPADPGVCFADLDKIEKPLLLRRWKTGDYFYPIGMGGKKKKLSRFFIDQKIPLHEKHKIWVLESSKRIVWVCGLRMDERFKITPPTQKILQIKMTTS